MKKQVNCVYSSPLSNHFTSCTYKGHFPPLFCRTLRFVPEESKDKTISDEDVLQALLKTFESLFVNDLTRQMPLLNFLPAVRSKYLEVPISQPETSTTIGDDQQSQITFPAEDVLFNALGFSIARRRSSLVSAGTGVFVTRGFVPKRTVVAMYPGTDIIYFQM